MNARTMRGAPDVSGVVMRITPKMAEEWLATLHERQRPLREGVVRSYAADMLSGAWRLTHQGLARSANGVLLDGQHRLAAIVRSGVTVEMMVSTVDASAFGVMDQGARRTIANQLGRSNQWVGAVGALWRLEEGAVRRNEIPSLAVVESVYERNREALDFAISLCAPKVFPSVAAGVVAYADPIDRERVRAIATRLVSGVGLDEGAPELTWRAWFSLRPRFRSEMALATSSVIRSALLGERLTKLQSAAFGGYRWLTTRRRILGIPNTPTSEQVPSEGNK